VTCALFADEIIFLFLGPKWKDTVVIFQLLTPMILALAFLRPFGPFLASLGMPGRSLKLALARAPFMITAYVIALPYGLQGVACATSTVMVSSVVPMIAYSIRGTMISLMDIARVVARPVLSIVVGSALAFTFQFFYGQSLSPISRLTLGGGLLVFSYLVMLLFVMGQKSFYLDLIRVLWQRPPIGEKKSVA
jgi:PST family polysaccharide transporter